MKAPSAQQVFAEIRGAEAARDKRLRFFRDQIDRYVGPFHAEQAIVGEDYDPENHEFEFAALVLPRLVFDNPRVRARSRAGGPQAMVAEAMQYGLNRWIRDSNMRLSLQDVMLDALFRWGVMLVVQAPDDRAEEIENVGQPYRPQVKRLSPKRVFWDSQALAWEECEFIGHKWVRRIDDLIEEAENDPEAGWDLKALRALPVGVDRRELGRADEPNAPDRQEVDGYEVWFPGVSMTDEEGYHGTIFTIATAHGAAGVKADWIRKPRPYYGHPEGPYTLFGFYPVPDDTYPLSPLTAVKGQADDLNMHTKAMQLAAARRKRILIHAGLDPAADQKITNALDGNAVAIDGFSKDGFVEVELAGLTAQMVEAVRIQRERLDRNSGIFEAQRGVVTGAATATENALAGEASGVRIGYLKQRASDCTTKVLEKVAWYLYHDERVAFPVGGEDVIPGMPWFMGGTQGPGASFFDLELEIEPYSMERTSEGMQQRRMMEVIQLATAIAPALVQNPHVNAELLMQILADSSNMPDMRKLIDMDALAEMRALMMQMQTQPQPQTPAPKLAGDSTSFRMGNGRAPSPGGSAAKPKPMGGKNAAL